MSKPHDPALRIRNVPTLLAVSMGQLPGPALATVAGLCLAAVPLVGSLFILGNGLGYGGHPGFLVPQSPTQGLRTHMVP